MAENGAAIAMRRLFCESALGGQAAAMASVAPTRDHYLGAANGVCQGPRVWESVGWPRWMLTFFLNPPKTPQVADPGTFARAPDAVLKTRKIIKARRAGGGSDGSGNGGGANPFAGVSLTAPTMPPPAAAAIAAANPFLAVKKDEGGEGEAKGEAPPPAAEPAAAPRSPAAAPAQPAADDDAPSAKPADDKPAVTAAAPSFGGGGGFSASGSGFGGLAAAAATSGGGFGGGGGGFGGAASGGFGALAAKAGAGGGAGFGFGAAKSDADAPPPDDDATKPAPSFGFPAAAGGGFPAPATVFGGGSGGGGAATPPLPPAADAPHLTGEEGEDTVFAGDGALFEYDPPSAPGKAGAWRERGKGELRVNVGGGASGGARMVMRSRGHLRLLLNAALWPAMKVTRMEGGKGSTFVVVNAAAGGGGDDVKKDALSGGDGDAPPPKLTTYAFRVGVPAKLDEFVAAVDENKGSE